MEYYNRDKEIREAIEAGANMVRIGSRLFGARVYR